MLNKNPTPDSPNLRDLAQMEFERAGGDVLKATEALKVKVLSDSLLFRTLMEPLVYKACYDTVTGVCRRKRSLISNAPQRTPAQNAAAIAGLASGTLLGLMAFPLWGGKLLREATKEEVLEDSQKWIKQGSDMVKKGRWLQMVADHVPPGKKVGDVLTEAKLQKFKNMVY